MPAWSALNAGAPSFPKRSNASPAPTLAFARFFIAASMPLTDGRKSWSVSPARSAAAASPSLPFSSVARMRFRPRPARVPWIALLLRTPIAAADSSIETPILAATGATNDIAEPSCRTLVLLLAAALARTSTTTFSCETSFRNPWSTFDAISAALARSSAPACASWSVGPIAATISLASKPARPRNAMPSAASDAENLVWMPSCFAVSVSRFISSPVACDTAWTVDIDCPNDASVRIERVMSATPPKIANARARVARSWFAALFACVSPRVTFSVAAPACATLTLMSILNSTKFATDPGSW